MQTATVNIPKGCINEAYLPYWEDQTPIQIYYGGSSSGKSTFLAQRAVKDILKGNRNYLVTRNVGRTIHSSVFNEINKVINRWGLNRVFKINLSDKTFTCENGYQILSAGLDDVTKLHSITPQKGVITDIWLEEALEIQQRNTIKELAKRLRGLSGGKNIQKRIMLSFNPRLRTHWIHNDFFKNFDESKNLYHDKDLLILRTTHADNRFLEQQDRDRLTNEEDQYYYDVYTSGKWGVLGDLIFTKWRIEDLTGLRDSFGTYYNGIDFGYSNDPFAFVRDSIKGKTLYITHELSEYGAGNDIIAEMVKPIIGREPVLCDKSEPKSIAELRSYGLNALSALGGPGSVNHGIQYLQQFEIVVHKYLQNVINELETYHWKKNKDGQVMNVPSDRDNHRIDALRYSVSNRIYEQPKEAEPEGNAFEYAMTGLR